MKRWLSVLSLFGVVAWWSAPVVQTQTGTRGGEWRDYGGDKGFTKYSPLDQITKANVNQLRIAWRRPAVDEALRVKNPALTIANNLRSTPLMVGGMLYASNGIGLVEAFDPGSGKTLWVQEYDGELRGGAPTRGIAYWGTGDEARILAVRGQYLHAINPKTGKLIRSFGANGQVDLLVGMGPLLKNFAYISAPQVCNDVVLIGAAMTDAPNNKEEPPGRVQAFDVRTGRARWAFNPIPRPGEVGNDTWENDSWSYSGEANTWTFMSTDEQLGLAYLPTGAPTNDMYGGHRHGDNLFGNTLVCVRCATGERVWHFQTVHHDLWDYDNNVAPVLIDITVDGRPIKAVVQLTKQAMAFVLDRATGKPVWPIEERPAPSSNTPGEKTARTQPFTTRPKPFDLHGLTMNDLIDFTPQLRAEAEAIAKRYVIGPIYTPPSIRTEKGTQGTLQMPGATGGAEWGGAPFDPETHIMYVPSITGTFAADLLPGDPQKTNLRYTRGSRALVEGPQGLPITKPPYGRITAINMNTGDHLWTVPNGDGPLGHPALKGLKLPPLGQPSRDMPLLTKTLFFLGQGDPLMVRTPPMWGPFGNELRAYDKTNGSLVWKSQLPAGATGALMTYVHSGKQYILMPIGSRTHPGEWVAFSLP
ncbi:MAG: pyrroloquinoline quinone-dependent dehydrogenase [Acidimicrobiia bacterium]|nr:pyrroloquinoline quinone-dependent dehydrogenase [Acidimicrobiia bacterium]